MSTPAAMSLLNEQAPDGAQKNTTATSQAKSAEKMQREARGMTPLTTDTHCPW